MLSLPPLSTAPLSQPLPKHWAIWPCNATDGPTNMATDSALMTHSQLGLGVWRWYSWSVPTISFGRNERIRGRFTEKSIKDADLAAVRRPTGGRALLHSRELTYSVTMQLAREYSWRDAYDAINRILCNSLRAAGLDVTLAGTQAPVKPDGPVCFDLPSEGELIVEGRKLVGSAVWRNGTQYLQHGSILLHDDQQLLSRAACVPLPPAPPAASLSALGVDMNANQLRDILTAAVKSQLNNAHFEPTDALLRSIELERLRYLEPEILWRR